MEQTLTRIASPCKVKCKVQVTVWENVATGELSFHIKCTNGDQKQVFEPDQELEILALAKKGIKKAKASAKHIKKLRETYGEEILTEDPFKDSFYFARKEQLAQEARAAVTELVNTIQAGRQ